MKYYNLTMILTVWLAAIGPVSGAEPMQELLRQGLFEEEANRNLRKAIENYQGVVQQFDEQRQIAGTAIFRLGECYRKLGQTNQAAAQYQRILEEFPDSESLVELSRQNLKLLGVELEEPVPEKEIGPQITTAEAERIREIKELIRNSPDLINAPQVNQFGRTPLCEAAARSQLEVARFLLDNGAGVNVKDDNQQAPLHYAARHGHKSMAELLLESGAEVNPRGKHRQTPLHTAAEQGFVALTKVLLENGADPSLQDSNGQTPLHFAVLVNAEVTELLLNQEVDVNAADDQGNTPLHYALVDNKLSTLKLLLEHGADPDIVTGETRAGVRQFLPNWPSGSPPLVMATKWDSPEAFDLLLKYGADVNGTNKDGKTALHVAAELGHINYAKDLIKHNSDVNALALGDLTPLHLAVLSGSVESVALLLEKGAKPNLQAERSGETALHSAVGKDETEILKILLRHNAETDIDDRNGYTPLFYAIKGGKENLAKALLQSGADVNKWIRGARGASNLNYPTYLHYALSANEFGIAKLLLQHGAEVNVKNQRGTTPLHFAAHRSVEITRLLLENGANPNLPDKDGETPYQNVVAKLNSLKNRFNRSNTPLDLKSYETVTKLMRKYGAKEIIDRDEYIMITRPGKQETVKLLAKSNHPENRLGLFEVVMVLYANQNPEEHPFAYPNLEQIKIRRLAGKGQEDQEMAVDLNAIFESGDCTQVPVLKWGDIVVIPERAHPVNQEWGGLRDTVRKTLNQCLQRKVEIKGKEGGHPFELTVAPGGDFTQVIALKKSEPTAQFPINSFWLSELVSKSGLVYTSSDLSNVTVKRNDPETGESREMTFDLLEESAEERLGVHRSQVSGSFQDRIQQIRKSARGSEYNPKRDLWLRDGDVIVIPEKE